jgi:hypothetical protein
VKPDGILDELQRLFLGFARGVAARQRRADRDDVAVLVPLQHNGKLVSHVRTPPAWDILWPQAAPVGLVAERIVPKETLLCTSC